MFAPLITAARQARAKIAAEGKAGSDEYVGGYRTAPARVRKAHDEITASATKSAAAQTAIFDTSAKAIERQAEHVYQIKKRYLQQEEAAAAASLKRQNEMGKSVISGAGRTFGGMVSAGIGVAGQVARGAGVNTDIGSHIKNAVALEKRATDISGSGYMEGDKGAAGQRQDPRAIAKDVRAAADAAAIDTDSAMSGLQKFTGLTSDLETGRSVLAGMAKLSKANAVNLDDMMTGAAEVANRLGDIPNKGQAIESMMTMLAKQGKLGAVEMRDMAKVLPGVLAMSGKLSGGREEAMGAAGTMFQITKRAGVKGGASAAATSVASFLADLTSKSGTKALDKTLAGVGGSDSLYTDKSHEKLKSLPEVLSTILGETGGDLKKISAALPNKKAGQALAAFAPIYTAGEKDHKGGGREAIGKLFESYGGKMSTGEVAESLARELGTTESKVQLFNNSMEKLAGDTLPKLVPAFEKLAPLAGQFADGMAGLAVYIAENPLKAAFLGLGASFAKEFAGVGLKAALETALGGSGGMKMGVATIAVASAAITVAAIDEHYNQKDKSDAAAENAGLAGVQAASALRAGRDRGTIGQDALDAAAKAKANLESRISTGENGPGFFTSAMPNVSALLGYITNDSVGMSYGKQADATADKDALPQLKADLATLTAATDRTTAAITGGVLRVTVTNLPGAGFAPGAVSGPVPVR